ncbi:MAG TPA: chromate transporter [Clostridia bacterium]|nr:chromate transporter [Clostridia bacterium]
MIKTLLILFFEFFKTGLFSVGGGLATIPFLYEMSDKYAWVTHAELANIIAVAEATPGPIGVNAATYMGFSAAGVLGGIIATLALVTPSVIIVTIVAKYILKYRQSKAVNDAFYSVRPASTGLIAAAALTVVCSALDLFAGTTIEQLNWVKLGVFALMLIATQVPGTNKLHPLAYMLTGAALGVMLKL